MTDHKTVRDYLERAKEDAEIMRDYPDSKYINRVIAGIAEALAALDRIEAALQTKPDPIFQCDDTPINKAYEG